ncbi:hypothetical protein ASPACDRAFT_47627 [Aspergillus aculeatus ATCC 16872]|uniref:Uncharacterized protein n=1 Tax=Aspergillus aculeatus (strain ATCC 16872 / CBS 172.66 / WB 5094) TaxID=690307 RepID=A0A1L9WHY6_ASPA1|nr:uncharacterized protein ASPACDRAFT_47627 [Aspergillus aculeatus ATCC 16872]OJJ95737.1 hypothetical protein ASPACDRAFT_47627 [Aspergillus aculeatus ATCC 16872]
MAEVLLPWLNGRLDLRQAYTFTLNDIVDTPRDIVQHPVSYGGPPPAPECRHAHLDSWAYHSPASVPIPEGWTNDPYDPELYFAYSSSEAYQSRCFGIPGARFVLLDTEDTSYIIASGGRYYCGNFLLEDRLFEITRPTTLPGILEAIASKGLRGLRMKTLELVDIDEEPPDEVPPEHEKNRVLVVPASDIPESNQTT